MRRLIDANANREKFKEIVYQTLNDCTITTKEKFNLIMTAFDNMPTAYDISKVVAELEDLQCVNPFLTTTEYEHKAIEIARKGGAE